MVRSSLTIAQVMTLTALVAVDLAMIPFDMWYLLVFPVFLAWFVSLNVVIVQAFVLGRPLGPFHYTFIVAGTVASIVITGVLGWFDGNDRVELWLGACVLTLLLAWGSGRLASRRAARRHRQVDVRDHAKAALLAKGGLIGFGLFVLGTTLLFSTGLGPDDWHPGRWAAYYAGLLASPVLGAMALSGSQYAGGCAHPDRTGARPMPAVCLRP